MASMHQPFALLEEAAALNSKIITLPRIQLLTILSDYHPEGVEFRELQASLGMSDGKLLSNLYALEDMGYIESQEVKVENKTLTAYTLTGSGLADWTRAKRWLVGWLGSS